MGDITNPRLIILKGFLFLLAGGLASALLLVLHPEWTVAFLLGVAVWSFARCYYFAFYVIQHYVDPTYRFAGLTACVLYLWRRGRTQRAAGTKE